MKVATAGVNVADWIMGTFETPNSLLGKLGVLQARATRMFHKFCMSLPTAKKGALYCNDFVFREWASVTNAEVA